MNKPPTKKSWGGGILHLALLWWMMKCRLAVNIVSGLPRILGLIWVQFPTSVNETLIIKKNILSQV